jgi:multicomponent K+:H+ antiporter subunit E/multicomponent Na+:H+ antiporter subunit E
MARRSAKSKALEWLLQWASLLGLYLLFVGELSVAELAVGAGVAALGVVAWEVVWEEGLGRAIADVRLFALARYLLAQTVTDTWRVLKVLALWLLERRPAPSEVRAVPFDPGGDDARSATRRALAVAYTSVTPNSIVLDVDRKKGVLLLHQIHPAKTSKLLERLGARE